jgi:hypothetical protein
MTDALPVSVSSVIEKTEADLSNVGNQCHESYWYCPMKASRSYYACATFIEKLGMGPGREQGYLLNLGHIPLS